jgi:hypothetical protein
MITKERRVREVLEAFWLGEDKFGGSHACDLPTKSKNQKYRDRAMTVEEVTEKIMKIFGYGK